MVLPLGGYAGELDKYGRVIGSCEVGDMDINREMVVAGLARAYRQY